MAIVCVFLTIRLIKKKIDLSPPNEEESGESVGPKYKDAESSQHIGLSFDGPAVKANAFQEYDTCTERFMKKMCELNVLFNPMLLALPLNLVLGRSYAFCIVIYFLSGAFCVFFNLFKMHRACVLYKLSRLFLESIWVCLSLLLLINIWTQEPSSMLYKLRQG